MWQIIPALSSDVTVTVACLIKGRDDDAESDGATGQKVRRVTEALELKKEKIYIYI